MEDSDRIVCGCLGEESDGKMKRIGKFTGRIYPDDYDFSNCPECCVVITEAEYEAKEWMPAFYRYTEDCKYCLGCPAAHSMDREYE